MHIRDRIRELRRVRGSELCPNPANWRAHPRAQRDALRAILAEIGYADALLARETSDGRLMLVDGHLRAETTPETLVPVLVLDVSDDEADMLLATLDPLAAMAQADQPRLDELLGRVKTDNAALGAMLEGLAAQEAAAGALVSGPPEHQSPQTSHSFDLPPRFSIIVDCDDEPQQTALLARFNEEGLRCRAFVL